MEAFALPQNPAIAPIGEPAAPGSVSLPPLVHKRELSETTTMTTPVKRRKLSETASSPSSPSVASSAPVLTPSHKTTSSRPNMTASSSITLDMLRPHFEEPLAKVAASFGICVTLLKKICRRHGIARWPHRQITGLRKSIASMEHAIGYFDGDRRESYAEQLLKQKNKLAVLLEDPTTSNSALASERHEEYVRNQVKVPPAQGSEGRYQVPPSSMTRASSPTGPLLPESPFYGTSSVAVASQPSPMYLPSSYQAEPSYTQKYHQLCPPSQQRLEMPHAVSYYVPTAVPIISGVSFPAPAIHLPPLRRESRSVLPPISSLGVGSSNSSSTVTSPASW